MFITKDLPITTGDYKREAKAQLSGNWPKAITLILIPTGISIILNIIFDPYSYTAANEVGNSPFFWRFLNDVLSYFLLTGVAFTLLDLVTQEYYEIKPFNDLFQVFTKYSFWKFLLLYLLKRLYLLLWTLLLIIPGIIKSFSYSQAEFIYKDYQDQGKELSPNEAITLSRELMDGHKMDYFVLQLSFIGWFFLSIILLGLPLLYVEPYYRATQAVFYRSIMLEHVGGLQTNQPLE